MMNVIQNPRSIHQLKLDLQDRPDSVVICQYPAGIHSSKKISATDIKRGQTLFIHHEPSGEDFRLTNGTSGLELN